jgi:hypothetical protein
MFAKVENGVTRDKIVPKFSPAEKQENKRAYNNFGLKFWLKYRSGVGWRPSNCHFGEVRGGSPAKKMLGVRLSGTPFFVTMLMCHV